MLISVEHTTAYSYSEPVLASTQYLRMTPLSGRTQAVESWRISCPGATTTPWQDQYGNLCHTLTVAHPVNELEIKVSGLVRTRDTNGVVGTAPSELPPGGLSERNALHRDRAVDRRFRRPLRRET
jgi:transglutaminase-like putative cysteine protease